ncbi:hypothetical protein ACN9JF_19140 (plasmid) [Pseudoalteromonas lipolytica]|uniref:hypothetical protein n=1 Tax=Pseudoalteromonas lipolytica TaxID=570156 RepID=UPI003B9F4BCA
MTDLDMLATFMEATKEPSAFENHPIAQQGIEGQLLYLQGLALVMNADNNIHETEVEYLQILINSFSLDNSVLDDVVGFAKAPDKVNIQAFVNYYRRKPLAQLFLFDALMMTRRDNQVHEKEMPLVNAIATQLEILKGTQQDIFDLFCHIKNRNWKESALYFSSHLLNPDYFKHLLAYHEVEYEALMAETATIRSKRLTKLIVNKVTRACQLKWEPLNYCNAESLPKEKEITIDYAPNIFTYDLLVPFLQSKMDRGELRVSSDEIFITYNSSEKLYGLLSDLHLEFDPEDNVFTVGKNYISGSELMVSNQIKLDYFKEVFSPLLSGENQDVNIILYELFKAKIAIGKPLNPKGKNSDAQQVNSVCFPARGKKCLRDEIVLGFNNKFYRNKGGVKAILISNKKYLDNLTLWSVLVSGQYRLVR